MTFKELLSILDPDSDFLKNDPIIYIKYWDPAEVEYRVNECISIDINPHENIITLKAEV